MSSLRAIQTHTLLFLFASLIFLPFPSTVFGLCAAPGFTTNCVSAKVLRLLPPRKSKEGGRLHACHIEIQTDQFKGPVIFRENGKECPAVGAVLLGDIQRPCNDTVGPALDVDHFMEKSSEDCGK